MRSAASNQQLRRGPSGTGARSTLVTQLDVATHRLQPNPHLIGSGRTARAIQPPSGPVLGNPLSFPPHAIPDVAAEGVDLIVHRALGRCPHRQVSADGLRLEISAL